MQLVIAKMHHIVYELHESMISGAKPGLEELPNKVEYSKMNDIIQEVNVKILLATKLFTQKHHKIINDIPIRPKMNLPVKLSKTVQSTTSSTQPIKPKRYNQIPDNRDISYKERIHDLGNFRSVNEKIVLTIPQKVGESADPISKGVHKMQFRRASLAILQDIQRNIASKSKSSSKPSSAPGVSNRPVSERLQFASRGWGLRHQNSTKRDVISKISSMVEATAKSTIYPRRHGHDPCREYERTGKCYWFDTHRRCNFDHNPEEVPAHLQPPTWRSSSKVRRTLSGSIINSHVERIKYKEKFELEYAAATKIQCLVRKHQAQKRWALKKIIITLWLRSRTLIIQRFLRRSIELRQKKKKALLIAETSRRLQRVGSARKIQRFWRMRKLLRLKRKAVIEKVKAVTKSFLQPV